MLANSFDWLINIQNYIHFLSSKSKIPIFIYHILDYIHLSIILFHKLPIWIYIFQYLYFYHSTTLDTFSLPPIPSFHHPNQLHKYFDISSSKSNSHHPHPSLLQTSTSNSKPIHSTHKTSNSSFRTVNKKQW